MKVLLTMNVLFVMLVTGCATLPFDPMPTATPSPLSADAVRDAFAAAQPQRYEALQSVVFLIYGRKLGGIGSLAVNYTDNSFALAAMTHAGMKLFALQGTAHTIESEFALAAFGEKKHLAAAVGEDVRRMYFDIVPPASAETHRRRYSITYIHRSADGRTEYDFAGPRQLLAEKRIYKGWKLVSRIRYSKYREHEGALHAHAVWLHNRTYNYKLLLRIKSVYLVE